MRELIFFDAILFGNASCFLRRNKFFNVLYPNNRGCEKRETWFLMNGSLDIVFSTQNSTKKSNHNWSIFKKRELQVIYDSLNVSYKKSLYEFPFKLKKHNSRVDIASKKSKNGTDSPKMYN